MLTIKINSSIESQPRITTEISIIATKQKNEIWIISEGDEQIRWYDCDGTYFEKGFENIYTGCFENEPMNDQASIRLHDFSIALYGDYATKYAGQSVKIYFYACNNSMEAIQYTGSTPYAINLKKCWSNYGSEDSYSMPWGACTDCFGDINLADAYASNETFYVGIKAEFEDGQSFWVKLDEIPSGSVSPSTKYNKRFVSGVDCYMVDIHEHQNVITNTYSEKTSVYETESTDVYLYVDIKTSTVRYNSGAMGEKIPAYTLNDNLGYSYNIPGYIGSNVDITLMQLSDIDPAGSLSKHFYWDNGRITGCKEGNLVERMSDGSERIYLYPNSETGHWHSTSNFYTPYVKYKEDTQHVYYRRYDVRIDR